MKYGCPKCAKVFTEEQWIEGEAKHYWGEEYTDYIEHILPFAEVYGSGVRGYTCPECGEFSSGKSLKVFHEK
ncbi:hypothetical protein JT05_12315 [Desulfosporosinus sp. Tol-M]|nr:hypothetical protein JT05_12315 [Desulfosporosinus sp. Tol-M]